MNATAKNKTKTSKKVSLRKPVKKNSGASQAPSPHEVSTKPAYNKKVPPMSFKAPDGNLIEVSYELIDPEYASELLTMNTKNRIMDERLVKSFAKKQKKKHWMFNGDSIRISATDVLLDGQNRLQSILVSGIPQYALIVRGLADETFSTMDDGRKRSASDILSIEKIEEPRKKAGIAKTVLLFSNGYYRSTKGGGDRSSTPSNLEILEFTKSNNDRMEEAIKVANEVKENLQGLNFKILSSMFFLFSKHGITEAREFFEQLKLGKKSEEENIKLFCAELSKDAKRDVKLPYNTILAYFIQTWNAFKSGDTLTKLSYIKNEDPFPIPQ